MLAPYRVLDLSDERGLLCGQILADLGADVIAVEPPGGSSARSVGPFDGEMQGPESSLFWRSFARNKRSLILDLESVEGREQLLGLAAGAHFLVESSTPGRLAELGLGYDDLAAINPALVYVSITGFGQDGPKSRYTAPDLVVSASACMLFGDPDRPPVSMAVPQAYLHASAEAAGAALIAHRERQRSGRGQHVDVSAQQATAQASQSFILATAIGDCDPERLRGGIKLGPLAVPQVWRTSDGHACVTVLFGPAFGPFARRLMEWVHEEGFCDDATRDKDWIAYLDLLLSGREPMEEYERVLASVASLVRSKSKAELLAAALERRLLIAPFLNIDELVSSPQLAAREYWRELDPEGGDAEAKGPGPFARLSETPIAYRRRAPRLGEHTEEVLADSGQAASIETAATFDSKSSAAGTDLPLAGLKVLDLMWVMAGPAATRVLADYGATVVRVESTRRPDTARTFQPFHDGQPGLDSSALFLNMNVGKLGMTLDLKKPEGRDVFLDLVRWADVVGESFSPKAMRAWGLDYDSLRRSKPDLIMLSSSLFGQSGPLSELAGFGNMAAAITGFNSLAGWPDREPALVGAYSDYVSPRYAVAALLAALEERDRTGCGQYIDLSQAEASLHFMAPAILDYTVNGHVMARCGNRHPQMAPHGLYPAADGCYVAVVVASDEQWSSLCEVMEQPALAREDRFATAAARCEAAAELDDLVASWTAGRDMREIEIRLQASGVPAHAVPGSALVLEDPQLVHRHHFVELRHPVHGSTTVEGSRSCLSRTAARVERAAPGLGQDTERVLSEILGYDADRIAGLARRGVLE